MEEQLKDLNNWSKKGGWEADYRFILLGKCAYEILVEYWKLGTPIEDATASLCLIGFWRNKTTKEDTIEREWLGQHRPIRELLEIAYNDYKENMK